MTAYEERDHDLLDHLFLADDDTPDLLDNFRLHLAKTRDPGFQNIRFQLCGDD